MLTPVVPVSLHRSLGANRYSQNRALKHGTTGSLPVVPVVYFVVEISAVGAHCVSSSAMNTLMLLALLSSPHSLARPVATGLFSRVSSSSSSSSSSSIALDRSFESRLQDSGYKFIIGVDEAGRGPLAGPVVSAAVMVSGDHKTLPFVNDSKKVADTRRKELYDAIINDDTITYAVDVTSSSVIDEVNILQATMRSMTNSINGVLEQAEQRRRGAAAAATAKEYHVVIDGNKCPSGLKVTATSVVKGDSKVYSIALASIIAKCHRDKLMVEYDRMYPEYNFQGHKGYPTQAHVLAVHAHGYSPIHRLSFGPLKGRQPNASYFKPAS